MNCHSQQDFARPVLPTSGAEGAAEPPLVPAERRLRLPPLAVHPPVHREHRRPDAQLVPRVGVQVPPSNAASPGRVRQPDAALRVRERELLTAHRREWCAGFGVPVEDVAFERGLVSAVRLKERDGGKLFAPVVLSRFAMLTELDLSGLKLTIDDLAAFADAAQFPRLRKLILSDNALSDAGANRLAKATGLPRLDTVYVFGNTITARGRAALTGSSQFRLTKLDFGERADGYCMSRGESEMARRRYIREHLLPFVQGYFDKYELLQSAMLVVAQYWDDEADDAVHGDFILSELLVPTLRGARTWHEDEEEQKDVEPDPNLPNTHIVGEYGVTGSVVSSWDDNFGAIPSWATFSPEGGHQDYRELSDVSAPATLFYRHGGYEMLPMVRPFLDGVRPECGADDN